MKIDLRCGCGAAISLSSGEFINGGGRKDEKGRVFVVEVRADEWQARHEGHRVPSPAQSSMNADDLWAITHPRG
jgi:hypothetical protein